MYLLPVLVDGFRVMSIHNKKENGGCNIMRKLRERLNNKKGFTLVELIVVIVIILILAAVLIPNVMRYINEARKSTFQSEASGYLTELQGYEAECYGKNNASITVSDFAATATDGKYTLTLGVIPDVTTYTSGEPLVKDVNADGAIVKVSVDKGSVMAFGYADSEHFVSWEAGKGWTDVDGKEFKE